MKPRSDRLGLWLPTVPEPDREAFERDLRYTNLYRMRFLAGLTIIVSLLLLLMEDLQPAETISDLTRLAIVPIIITLHVSLLAMSIVFMMVLRLPASPEKLSKRHMAIELLYFNFLLFAMTVATGLSQVFGGNIGGYMLTLFAASAIIQHTIPLSLAYYGGSWGFVALMIIYLRLGTDPVAYSNLTNGSIIAVMAITASWLGYDGKVRQFTNQRLIERQKDELARSNEKLRRLSLVDGLTKIPNRRCFDDMTRREWMRATRQRTSMAIIMIDIDNFKKYNDTYGHQAGDEVLQRVAYLLNAMANRPADLIARYGGEEFVALLPDTGIGGARYLAERMRRGIYELNLPHAQNNSRRVTISLGISALYPFRARSPQELIHAADVALYQAKAAGRNQWVANDADASASHQDGFNARQSVVGEQDRLDYLHGETAQRPLGDEGQEPD